MEIHYWHLLASPLSEDVTLCGFNVGANMYTYMPTTYVIIFQDYCPSVVAIYQYFLFFCNEGGTNRGLVSAGSCFPYTDLVFIQFPCVGRMRLKFCFNVEWPYAEIQTNDKIYLLSLCLWIHKAFLVCAMKNVPTQGWNPQNEVFFSHSILSIYSKTRWQDIAQNRFKMGSQSVVTRAKSKYCPFLKINAGLASAFHQPSPL